MKKQKVAEMFDHIAPRYDFLNHFLSVGIDKLWRRKLVKMLSKEQPQHVLDVATGTGDLAIAVSRSGVPKIIGVDISEQMISIGQRKVNEKGLSNIITLQYGDSERLVFESDHFDAVTVAFGVRNFEHLEQGLSEMCRVLRIGGKAYILEFSMPSNIFVKTFYKFYFKRILPLVGRLLSGHAEAYTYLPESVERFPQNERMVAIMETVGFSETSYRHLTFGIATIYVGKK